MKMEQLVNVFLPMRAGSERVVNKNTKTFAKIQGGLARIKIEQLLKAELISQIVISTNDIEVINIAKSFCSNKIVIVKRSNKLASSHATTDALIEHAGEIMPEGHILWTHVTSPFVNSNNYDSFVQNYIDNLHTYDSLMTVTKLQKFVWRDNEPITHDRKVEKWPRTQTINPLWEVNSAAFIASREIYRDCQDRIGKKPYLFETTQEVSFDIDWPEDFELAEKLFIALRDQGKERKY